MNAKAMAVISAAMLYGCVGSESLDETHEIVDNLVKSGFVADDIVVVNGVVYVGRDTEVSLAASREMLQTGDTAKEQYRTTNLISTGLAKICVDGSTFTGVFSTGLDLAIQNYDELPLTFAMARTPSSGCSFTIKAVLEAGLVGGHAGFPSGGLPFGTIFIGDGLRTFTVDVIEHVITHEIGHTIGLRHSDYFDRSISCGGNMVTEDDPDGIGAILIPGTPSTARIGGSVMNACFSGFESGEFFDEDRTALRSLYGTADVVFGAPQQWSGAFCQDGEVCAVADVNGDGNADAIAFNSGAAGGTFVALSNGSSFGARQQWTIFTCRGNQTCLLGDVNNDHKADLVALVRDPTNDVFVALSDGTKFGAPVLWSDFFCLNGEVCSLADVNGDGRSDLIAFNHGINGGTTGVFVGLSNGVSFGAPKLWSSFFCLANETCEVGDVNADGWADIMAFTLGASPRVFVGLSDATSFGAPQLWSDFFCLPGEVCRAADFSGDGRADVIAFNHGINNGTTAVFVAASLNVSFTPPNQASSFFCLAGETCEVGDVNGDRRADIIAFTRGATPRAFVGLSTR